MNVLYVITTFDGGGAESQLYSFCKCLKEQTGDISFSLCALKKGGVFEKKLRDSNLPYQIIGGKSFIKHIVKVHKIIKQKKINIVHAHMMYSDLVCRLATIGTKCKVVSTHHGLGKWKKKWLIFLDKITKKRVSHFIVVSEKSYEIRKEREKYPPSKMSVIYNGIPDSFFEIEGKTLSNEKIVFGCVARFTKNKQMHLLVEVLNALRGDKRLCVEFVGEGDEMKSVKELVNKYKLSNRVVFHGWSDNVKSIISKWHFFMLCSINEDFPVSLLEAMACGLVPIASRVGGIPYILNDGQIGSLCNPELPESFALGISKYLSNNNLYNIHSCASIKRIQDNFSIEKNVYINLK